VRRETISAPETGGAMVVNGGGGRDRARARPEATGRVSRRGRRLPAPEVTPGHDWRRGRSRPARRGRHAGGRPRNPRGLAFIGYLCDTRQVVQVLARAVWHSVPVRIMPDAGSKCTGQRGPNIIHPFSLAGMRGVSVSRRRDTPERGGRSPSRVRNPDSSGFSLWGSAEQRAQTMYVPELPRQFSCRERVETPWRDRRSASG
jgi:hypothetical protein